MSPVRVKLGDFGVSKQIQDPTTTTFHTQVSTPAYGAPEVLGLDSTSETSEYTNSVDVWSLGCVIYELLVGTKLFVSVGQLSRYYFRGWPFPEDELKRLSPPTSNIGISLIKSMLQIQPERRPTAAEALGHAWLADLRSHNEYSGDGDKAISRDEATSSGKRKRKPATHKRSKKRKRKKNTIVQDDMSCIPGGVSLGVNAGFQKGGDSTTLKPIFDTSVMSIADAPSSQSLAVQAAPQKPKPMPHYSQAPHSKGPSAPQKKRVCDIPPACPKCRTPNTKLKLRINNVLLIGTRC